MNGSPPASGLCPAPPAEERAAIALDPAAPPARGQWGVYMLLCGDGSLYTGCTNDFSRRLRQHLAGRGAKYTRSHGPLRPVYWENAESRSAALSREYALKQLSADQKRRLAGLPS